MTEDQKNAIEGKLKNQLLESGVPKHNHDSIIGYIVDGIPLGDFLAAVFANDLMESFGRADFENRISLFEICGFVYNYAPMSCHGNYERVKEWIKNGGLTHKVENFLTDKNVSVADSNE